MVTRLRQRLRHDDATRGAVRFAVAILVANLLVRTCFGTTTAAVLGSFAVLVHCYFLDFDGDLRERLIGHSAATLVGLGAVALGTVTAEPLALAVAAALVVSATFAFTRALRGYVARSTVGLQIPFFIPLFAAPGVQKLPALLGAWLLGSVVAAAVAAALLPHRRSGAVRRALAEWLDCASRLARALTERVALDEPLAALQRAFAALVATNGDPANRPGAVSRRQRALVQMVDRALWSVPIVERIRPLRPDADTALLTVCADALAVAATTVGGATVPTDVPDVRAAREHDLSLISRATDPARVREHALVRAFSIASAIQLWLAGRSRGLSWREPDVGSVADSRPAALLRTGLRADSVWLHNALRSGVAVAACVLLVREYGLQEGLWVVLAALVCINQTFSAPATGRSFVGITAGAVVGVALAGALLAVHPSRPVFVVALPVFAAAAKLTQARGTFWAQATFTPFVLVDLALLSWPLDARLTVVRIEDVLLGALVAAGLTVLVFPYGLSRRLVERERAARDRSVTYLARAVAAARAGTPGDLTDLRAACAAAVADLSQTLDAANVQPGESGDLVSAAYRSLALDRERIIGGDVCALLARQSHDDLRLVPVAAAFADWWEQVVAGEPAA